MKYKKLKTGTLILKGDEFYNPIYDEWQLWYMKGLEPVGTKVEKGNKMRRPIKK